MDFLGFILAEMVDVSFDIEIANSIYLPIDWECPDLLVESWFEGP